MAQFDKDIRPILRNASPVVHLRSGSFLSPEISASWPLEVEPSLDIEYIHDWTDADVVFANSTCFPTTLMRQIEMMCRNMTSGSRVITFTTGLNSEYFKVCICFKLCSRMVS